MNMKRNQMWDEYLKLNETEELRLKVIQIDNIKTLNKIIYVLGILVLSSLAMQIYIF